MNIEEAIEGLKWLLKVLPAAEYAHQKPAIKLGIEALKRIKQNRHDNYMSNDQLLPGEIEE